MQPDDADVRHRRHAPRHRALVPRRPSGGPAIGPSHVDPRTGEILDADILFTDDFTRGSRRFVVRGRAARPRPRSHAHALPGIGGTAREFCTFGDAARTRKRSSRWTSSRRAATSIPTAPRPSKFVYDYVKEVITHEVGHTLGLRHNFRSSTIYTAAQLQDPEFTKKNGIVGSVMDYPPFNIPLEGREAGRLRASRLGPYDYWAIEYAYKPIDPADGEGGAREDRRARREGAAARLRHRRGLVHRRRAAGHGPRR